MPSAVKGEEFEIEVYLDILDMRANLQQPNRQRERKMKVSRARCQRKDLSAFMQKRTIPSPTTISFQQSRTEPFARPQ